MNNKNSQYNTHKHWGQLSRSLLNSMIGDYLEKENNPLAIKMGYYHHFNRLSLDDYLAYQVDFPLSNKVVVFVHGLTDMESIWNFPVAKDQVVTHYIDTCFDSPQKAKHESYGEKLQASFGYSPFYLRYNTGLSAEKNGRAFAAKLSKLFEIYPIQIDELMLVGFSLGGLVIRHAQSCAQKSQLPWLTNLSKCVYLGAPKEDSAIQKLGHLTGEVLRYLPRQEVDQWAEWLESKSAQLGFISQQKRLALTDSQVKQEISSYAPSARHYFAYAHPEETQASRSTAPSLVPACSQNAHFEGLAPTPLAHSERVYKQLETWVRQDELSESRAELIQYNAPESEYLHPSYGRDDHSLALLAGALDFVASAYDKAVEVIETTHYSIAEEPFYAVQKYPVLSQLSAPVEKAHRKLLNIAYRSLRKGGKVIHRVTRTMAPQKHVSRQAA